MCAYDFRFLEENALKAFIQAIIKGSKKRNSHGESSPSPNENLDPVSDGSPNQETRLKSYSPVPRRDMAPLNENGTADSDEFSAFDPSAVFFLEVMVQSCLQNKDRIRNIWPIVSAHLRSILSNAETCPPVLLERVISGILRLASRMSYNVFPL